jgi:hypothetical protein
MESIIDRYAQQIKGVISCFDRVVITGTFPDICYSEAMASYLSSQGIRLFDLPRFAEPLRDEIRDNAQRLAEQNGLEIEYISKKNFRKEQKVKKVIAKRGEHPGLVHIFSALETCKSFRPWHDKAKGKTLLKMRDGKCLHYYFYFIDKQLGLCYLRVPTWAPFRLQFYFNGHNWLANQLSYKGIDFVLADNAFIDISSFDRAQRISDCFNVKRLHKLLDSYSKKLCPVTKRFVSGIHWSIMQVEYATDIVFWRRNDLQALYEPLIRTAVHAVKAADVATFLGRKLSGNFKGELGNDFGTRVEGTRIKHHMARTSIKMYDKHGLVLRLETTSNDVTFFRHHRSVEHRDGTCTFKDAPVLKSVYSLGVMSELLGASNRRYLSFLSALDQPVYPARQVHKLASRVREKERSYRGLNLMCGEDVELLVAIARGEFCISGLRNIDLQKLLGKSGNQVSRLLKMLRLHGVLKKVARRHKYYLTKFGERIVALALRLREETIIPALAQFA